jgi:hypothetical protein
MMRLPSRLSGEISMPLQLPDPMDFTPPPLRRIAAGTMVGSGSGFLRQSYGLEHLDADRPALYVGNHTIYGILDAPLMVLDMYEKTGIYCRSLGDHVHFKVPGWREMLLQGGAVDGVPENCSKLMQGRQHIIVYPGGAREVMKNEGEQYRLVWKHRTGFARMAMQHGYDIIPFAALGADDAYAIRYDSQRFRQSLLGKVAQKTGVMDALFRGWRYSGTYRERRGWYRNSASRKKCISCLGRVFLSPICKRISAMSMPNGACVSK